VKANLPLRFQLCDPARYDRQGARPKRNRGPAPRVSRRASLGDRQPIAPFGSVTNDRPHLRAGTSLALADRTSVSRHGVLRPAGTPGEESLASMGQRESAQGQLL
jgi:hypothetical protein